MKIPRILYISISLFALYGCSSTMFSNGALVDHDKKPKLARFDHAQTNRLPVSAQFKVKSAGHWQAISDHLSSKLYVKIADNDQPISVVTPQESKFSSIFNDFVKSSLSAKGIVLTDDAASTSTQISTKVASVRHLKAEDRYRPGQFAVLGLGVKYLSEISNSVDATVGALLGAELVNSAAEAAKTPETEIVITTVLTKDGLIQFHRSDVYYIDTIDTGLFESSNKTFNLTSQ